MACNEVDYMRFWLQVTLASNLCFLGDSMSLFLRVASVLAYCYFSVLFTFESFRL